MNLQTPIADAEWRVDILDVVREHHVVFFWSAEPVEEVGILPIVSSGEFPNQASAFLDWIAFASNNEIRSWQMDEDFASTTYDKKQWPLCGPQH